MKSWSVCVLMRVDLLQVRTMRDAFNSVKSIFAMHTSKALKLIYGDALARHVFDRSGAASAPTIPACPAVETNRFCVAFPW
jgi:hypothetical protein